MAGNGNDNTVDAVVAGRVIQDVVLDTASPCNVMPFHTMEALGLKPTWPSNFLFLPTDIDLGSAVPAGRIEDIPVDIGPVRVLSTFQILKMQNNNSYPLLLGAPYMRAVEYFPVQAAATLSLEGLVVKDGKVVRLPFSQQQRRAERMGSQCHSFEMRGPVGVQGDDLPQPSACPDLVSNLCEQRRGSQYNPIVIQDTVDLQGDDLPQPSADPGIVPNSPQQLRGSQYNPIVIQDTVDVKGDDLPQPSADTGIPPNSPQQLTGSQYHPIEIQDIVDVQGVDLPQPSAGPGIVSNSPEQSAAYMESRKEKNQSAMQVLVKAHKLQVEKSVRQTAAKERSHSPHERDSDMARKQKRCKSSALDESCGPVRKQVDDAGPLRVVEDEAQDTGIDPAVTHPLHWVQYTIDRCSLQPNSQKGAAALVKPQHHNKHQDQVNKLVQLHQVLGESPGPVRKRVDDAGPSRFAEDEAQVTGKDAVVAHPRHWVQNTQYILDQFSLRPNSKKGAAALVKPQHHNRHQDQVNKLVELHQALDESPGPVRKRVDNSGPSRVAEDEAQDTDKDAVVAHPQHWVQNTQHIFDRFSLQPTTHRSSSTGETTRSHQPPGSG